jgi:hypothetical protein
VTPRSGSTSHPTPPVSSLWPRRFSHCIRRGLRFALLSRKGERRSGAPPSPSLAVIEAHTPLRSHNRQAGRSSSPSEERRPGFCVRIGPLLRRGALLMYKLGNSHEFRKHKKPITSFGARPHPVGGPDPIGSVRSGLSRSSMLGVFRSVRHESAPEVLSLLL